MIIRPIRPEDEPLLVKFHAAQKARFAKNDKQAAALGGAGPGDVTERAAWTALARVLMNLDEFVTKN